MPPSSVAPASGCVRPIHRRGLASARSAERSTNARVDSSARLSASRSASASRSSATSKPRATRGATAFDFAALIAEWDLPCAHVARAAGLEPAVLAHALRLYRYTCALWYRLSDNTARS